VKKEEWITAADALRLLKPVFGEYTAQLTICKRAHAGLIRARAEHYIIDNQEAGAREVPQEFWWAEGHSALEQNWTSGDFTTYTNRGNTRHRAFGVSFSRADIEKLIPTEPDASPAPKPDGETGRVDGEWDVFISHASEDMEDFVRPLAESLSRSGLRVWYDEFTLKVGDSLRRSIDYGLDRSRYGIVVISPSFLKKDWPQRELDGLVAREVNGLKLILPVWHDIRADRVRSYSPTLADRVAVSSSEGIDEVTKQIMQAIGKGDAKPSQIAARSPLAQPDGNRPLRFVQNEQQSFWAPCSRGQDPGTQVAGHWHVTNTTDRNIVLLRVRFDGHLSVFSNVLTEGMREDRLYSSTHPIPAHQMGRVSANCMFYPPIISGADPLIVDVIFTDNYENEHRTRSITFRFVRA
jgi:hypothetical protein